MQRLGDVFLQVADFMKTYTQYVKDSSLLNDELMSLYEGATALELLRVYCLSCSSSVVVGSSWLSLSLSLSRSRARTHGTHV